jgi:hypothetical protein
MASFRKRGAFWYFRYLDETGKQVERKGCASRVDTEGLAAALVPVYYPFATPLP